MTRNLLRKKRPLLLTLWAMFTAAAVYIVGMAAYQSKNSPINDFQGLLAPRLIDVVLVTWLMYFCSSIGSFLNVVAWRMPRGESVGGRSHCPRCANALLNRDNVPVLGWISLRGRCRFCSLPISTRYPIVEFLVGLTMTLVGFTELNRLSLPNDIVHAHAGPAWSPLWTGPMIGMMCYHATALSMSWAMALIRLDGTKLPGKLMGIILAGLVLPMIAWPTAMVVPWQTLRPGAWTAEGQYTDAIMRVITAFVAAAFAGRVVGNGLCPNADLKLDPLGKGSGRLVDLIWMLFVPAILLGWQTLPAVVLMATALSLLTKPLLDRIDINQRPAGKTIQARGMMERFSFAIPIATALHLAFWHPLWSLPFWPSDHSGTTPIMIATLFMLAVPMVLRDTQPTPASMDLPPVDDDELKNEDAADEVAADEDAADEGNADNSNTAAHQSPLLNEATGCDLDSPSDPVVGDSSTDQLPQQHRQGESDQ